MPPARADSTKIYYVEETSFGVTPPNPVMRLIPFTSEKLGVNSSLFTQVGDAQERMFASAGSGYIDAGGSMTLDIELDSIGTLLKHALGEATSSGSSAPFTHVIRGGSALPPGLSIEKGFSDVGQFMLFKGCRIDAMSLDFPTDGGQVGSTLDIVSKTAQSGSVSVASSLAESDGASISYKVSVEDGANALDNILGVKLLIRNHLDRDGFVLDSRERFSINEGLRQVSGSLVLEFEDFGHYSRHIDLTASSIKITASQGALSMEVFLPRVVFTGSVPVPFVKDAGPIVGVVNFIALKDSAEGTDIKITLVNNQAVI